MTLEYVLASAIITAIYLGVKQLFPDFPLSDVAFQTFVMYVLVKIGVNIVGKPAEAIRNFFAKG
jgi:hypothetical protein